jgi:hypothetical protein
VSRSSPIAKLAKASRLTAEAQRLQLEALEELAANGEDIPVDGEPLHPTPTPPPTEVDAARARRYLRQLPAPDPKRR